MAHESIERVAIQLKILNVAILVVVVMMSTTCVLGLFVQQADLKERIERIERKKSPKKNDAAHPGLVPAEVPSDAGEAMAK